jgi:hypothetical protein
MKTTALGISLLLLVVGYAPAAVAQSQFPTISTRQFVSGSAVVKVTGSFQIDAEIPISGSSWGEPDKTWLQYGLSGTAEPEATITFDPYEIGIIVGLNKKTATAGIQKGDAKPQCTGKVEVTPKLITGHYTCPGVTSYDPGTRQMGTVNIEVRFTARS